MSQRMELSPEVQDLAQTIRKLVNTHLEPEAYTYHEQPIGYLVDYVERVVTETFTPNLIDKGDYPIGDREEVTWWASVDAAKDFLGK